MLLEKDKLLSKQKDVTLTFNKNSDQLQVR